MSMKLAEKTWPFVDDYLKNCKTIIVPIGSTEQHGPSGILGIDYLSTESLAQESAIRLNILVTPTLPFGMAVHHMAFPGTISFTPLTYIQVIVEIISSLSKHGFEQIIFINGHGGNIAPVNTAFCEAQQNNEKLDLKLINWWLLPNVQAYEEKHFGGENGFHATVGEISLTMFTHPDGYKNMVHPNYFKTQKKTIWPLSPFEFRKTFPDGRMGSNPSLCSKEHGKALFDLAVLSICHLIKPPT